MSPCGKLDLQCKMEVTNSRTPQGMRVADDADMLKALHAGVPSVEHDDDAGALKEVTVNPEGKFMFKIAEIANERGELVARYEF